MFKIKNGYTGRQLRIDLNDLNVRVADIDMKLLEEFIGGVGVGVKLLYNEIKRGTDSLDPESKIIFTTSPLSISRIPGGGSVMLCFKAPATNGWGESRCGGEFGPDLRRTGFENLIIGGKSEKPLYVVIDGENVEFKSAHHLIGKTVSEKERIIRNELPKGRFSIMCIGPAGERLVRFSTVMCGDRAAGRGGAGAVMGSKNLIAIAIRSRSEDIHVQSEQLMKAVKRALDILRSNPVAERIKKHGTTGDIVRSDEVGNWPTKESLRPLFTEDANTSRSVHSQLSCATWMWMLPSRAPIYATNTGLIQYHLDQ
jgi:aldehyde:ferredoxin oxidoreductase